MPIDALRRMTPGEVFHAVDGFSARYVADWDAWLAAKPADRPAKFGAILRGWHALRPLPMRRLRIDARHDPPFLDDVLEAAAEPLLVLRDVDVLAMRTRIPTQDAALTTLWNVFMGLPTLRHASCVGVSKAVLLLTDGRIGPALDSRVRAGISVAPPATSGHWIEVLRDVGDDIAAFESRHGPLANAVPPRFQHLAVGRLYDMVFGPR